MTSTESTLTSLTLPILPTPGGVVFPEMVLTIVLETSNAQEAATNAVNDRLVLVPRSPESGIPASIGTLAKIEDRGELPNGLPVLTVRTLARVRLGAGVVGTGNSLWITADPVDDTSVDADDVGDLANQYRTLANRIMELVGARRAGFSLPGDDSPGALADTISYWPELTYDQRVTLLETVDVRERLELAIAHAEAIVAELGVSHEINSGVQEQMESDQREAILRRQLRAIQTELGGDDADVIADYRAKLADADLPEATAEALESEIDRLERVGEQSQEASWIRTWLDTAFDIPFADRTDDNHDLTSARATLDADHTGLDDVKDRIVEHLAIRKLQAERGVDVDARDRRGSAILALVGPPGVGKTSLGESIAEALGRKFSRLALGGIHDEAEIRGHRRTYVGARPGRLVRALIEAGSMNPVILLDEIDKVGSDWRGDPSSALLEVLDPAQNHRFRDHYLEFELDLSDVIFIATANELHRIPGPLLDRVEIIPIDGYSDDEKTTIARDHILPRILRRLGLETDEVALDDEVLARVAADWTREAGVRSLERRLDKLVRKSVTAIETNDESFPVTITDEQLTDLLGKPIPRESLADRTATPGVATGLAVTGAGGDVLFVEATSMAGEPGLTLTGQLGDVMKESGEIARSWLRSHADDLGIEDPDRRIHVHFPAGAVPKDGPSAGITMTTALVSLLTGRCVRPEVAMTGEVTLAGRVLPIGGVKQKVLAAHRAGITTIVLPHRNGDDLDDVPDAVRDALDIHLVETIDEVLAVALTDA